MKLSTIGAISRAACRRKRVLPQRYNKLLNRQAYSFGSATETETTNSDKHQEIRDYIGSMSTDDRREFIKKVEEDEFGRMSSEEKACAHTVAYTTFKKIDADGSGDVSPVEFARWYFMQGPNACVGDGDEEVTKEKYNQYLLRIGIPFLAFGFMDNGLMIVCGDLIDSHITHGLGFSVMFSAAAGNIIADVSGVGFGDAVERWLSKLGLKDPQLTTQQLQHQKIRRGRTIASLVGISCGCVLGMLPLLLI